MKTIKCSMAGTVWKILIGPGAQVEFGDSVLILESMKMEIPIESDAQGKVIRVLVEEGHVVDEGTPLFEIE